VGGGRFFYQLTMNLLKLIVVIYSFPANSQTEIEWVIFFYITHSANLSDNSNLPNSKNMTVFSCMEDVQYSGDFLILCTVQYFMTYFFIIFLEIFILFIL
jgi:hypothetical protein